MRKYLDDATISDAVTHIYKVLDCPVPGDNDSPGLKFPREFYADIITAMEQIYARLAEHQERDETPDR